MGDRVYELKLWQENPELARRAGFRPPSAAEKVGISCIVSTRPPPEDRLVQSGSAQSPFSRLSKKGRTLVEAYRGPEVSGRSDYRKRD